MLSKLTVALSAFAVGAPAALVGGVDALGYVGVTAIAALTLVIVLLLVLDRDVLLRSRTSGGLEPLSSAFPSGVPLAKAGPDDSRRCRSSCTCSERHTLAAHDRLL